MGQPDSQIGLATIGKQKPARFYCTAGGQQRAVMAASLAHGICFISTGSPLLHPGQGSVFHPGHPPSHIHG